MLEQMTQVSFRGFIQAACIGLITLKMNSEGVVLQGITPPRKEQAESGT